jgi:hypothetical protein
MAVKLRKPILVGGIGLSVVLWIWDSLQHSKIEIGEISLLGAIALGAGFWFLRPKSSLTLSPVRSLLTKAEMDKALDRAKTAIERLETEAPEKNVSELKQQLTQLPELLNRQELQIAIAGGQKVGKTSLKNLLDNSSIDEKASFVEISAFFAQNDPKETVTQTLALTSDLVIFITAGDLTDSEWQTLKELYSVHQRLLLVFNKQDRYLPEERLIIWQQLQQRVDKIIASEDVIAISALPAAVKVRQQQQDGSFIELRENPAADINKLNDRLKQVLETEREQLVLATTWREAVTLKTKAKEILNQVKRDRAIPVIEQYQWIAAAAAFANPVAALDLLATAAINAQMLVDLSAIYQQKFSLSQAQTASTTIGKLMVQLGLVELSTNAIGSILKSSAVTYVAGGAVQGVSAAYLTRLAGLSLIEYFQEQEIGISNGEGLNLERLGEKLKQVFQQNQRGAFLQNFVPQAIASLLPESKQTQPS